MKRILRMVLWITVLVLSLVAVASAQTKTYCICGDAVCTSQGEHRQVAWQPWDGTGTAPTSGYWYLTRDTVLTAPWIPAAYSTLGVDLNGCTLSTKGGLRIFDLTNTDSVLILTDSSAQKTGTVDYSGVSVQENFGYGIRMNKGNTTVNMYGGTITGTSFAGTGGAGVLMGSGGNATSTVFNMYGGKITDGAGGKGGNVFAHLGVFNMYGGTIANGYASGTNAGLGGNFFLNNLGSTTATKSTLNIYGGTVSGGKAKLGTAIYAHGKAVVHINAGEITGNATAANTGAVHLAENSVIKVGGTARIWENDGSNVYLTAQKTVTVSSTLKDGACIGVTLESYTNPASDSYAFVVGSGSKRYPYFLSDQEDYTVKLSGTVLVLAKAGSYRLNGSGRLNTFEACVEAADFSQKDFVQLCEDVDSLSVTTNTYLNLNGFDIAQVDIARGVTLYVFDTATDGYTAENCGMIAAITGEGSLAATCLSSQNRRYLTLQGEDGYSFHRFWLSVTHCVINRNYTGLTFKIKLTCNEQVAAAIDELGVNLFVNDQQYLDAQGNGDIPVPGLEFTSGGMVITVETRGPVSSYAKEVLEAEQKINAYIKIGQTRISCAQRSRSLKQLILQLLDTAWDNDLSAIQRDLLADFYRKYGEAAEMDSWGDSVTQKLKPASVKTQPSDCLCGDKSSTDNPCADAGHQQVTWTDWAGPELPTASGYYRLTRNLMVTQTAAIQASNHVHLDLNGHIVMQTTAELPIVELKNSGAKFTLTDHAGGGRLIPLSASDDTNPYGMTVNLHSSNNYFYMYGGIIDCTGKEARYGVGLMVWKGKAYMYGGTITGGHSTAMGGGGGNVIVYTGAYFYMYDGLIENGTSFDATSNATYGGGNLRVSTGGNAYLYGGTIRNGQTQRNHGGNICNIGTLYLRGGVVTGGSAVGEGGGIYSAGTLRLSGTPVVKDNQKSDVALAADTYITMESTGMQEGACVGVKASQFTGPFTTANSYANAENGKYFFSNVESYATVRTSDNGLIMGTDGYSAGYAAIDISPDPSLFGKVGLSGYDNNATRLVTEVDEENPLLAICTAVADGKGGIVMLISVDTAALGTNVPTKIAAYAEQTYGIPKYSVVMSSNHQHSTPSFSNGYQTQVIEALKDLVDAAIADLHPVTAMDAQIVDVGANQFNFVRNYQYLDANGNPIPGAVSAPNHEDGSRTDIKGTTNGKTYESTADSQVQLLRITREDADPVLLMNFQMHPLLLTSGSSTVAHADVIGHFRNAMEEATGFHVMYFNGAAGNIHPFSDIEGGKKSSNMIYIGYGKKLAQAVVNKTDADGWVNAMGEGAPHATVVNASHACDVRLNSDDVPEFLRTTNPNFANYTDAQLVAAMVNRAKELHTGSSAKGTWSVSDLNNYGIYSIYHAKHIVQRISYQKGQTLNKNISVAVFGDVAFAIAPYEMFDTNGMQIKQGSPYAMTFVVTMATAPDSAKSSADGVSGYIPSMLAFQNGGYSTDISHFAAGTGEALAEHFVEMLQGLRG